jgi:hypothetical protein
LVGWSVGWIVGWSVGSVAGRLVSCLLNCFASGCFFLVDVIKLSVAGGLVGWLVVALLLVGNEILSLYFLGWLIAMVCLIG